MAEQPIRGIVFDMDGVLVLSSQIHAEAFRAALAEFPFPAPDYRSLAGMRTDDAMRMILSERGIPYTEESIARLSRLKTATARSLLLERYPLASGSREMIPLLAGRYLLGLASSGSRESVEMFLDSSGLRIHFTVALNGGDVERAKPAPDIYRLAFERLNLAAEECLIVEDAVSGVLAGKAASAVVWGLAGSTSSAEDLMRAGADRVIAGLDQLRELCR